MLLTLGRPEPPPTLPELACDYQRLILSRSSKAKGKGSRAIKSFGPQAALQSMRLAALSPQPIVEVAATDSGRRLGERDHGFSNLKG